MTEHTEIPEQPDQKVGEIFKKARLEKGIGIDAVFAFLKMRPRIIKALEESDFDTLPDEVSTLAFVRSYAKFLGLDVDPLIAQTKKEMIKKPLTHLHISYPKKQRSALRPLWWMIILAIICAVAALGWERYNKFDHAVEIVKAEMRHDDPERKPKEEQQSSSETILLQPQIEGANRTSETVKENEAVKEEKKPEVREEKKESKPQSQLTIEGRRLGRKTDTSVAIKAESGESWMEIYENGQIVFSHLMRKGDVYFVPDKKGLTAKFGHAGVMDIYKSGIKQNRFKPSDIVMRDVNLDGD